MRMLHTSDWHLGRSFHRVSMLEAQRAFIQHLVRTVHEREVEAVLVAGDVYDRAVPPLAAIELFDDALHQLAHGNVPTILISGNHDSARRLGVASGLIKQAGIHLHTDPARCGTPVVLPDAHGDVAFYGVPYLEPSLARAAVGAARARHTDVLGAALDRVRADLADRPAGTRSVVLAHAFVAGGTGSDSERDITVGGVSAVPAAVFDGVDYVALGHLHGSQRISDRVRYSGSPLAYSFSEVNHRKSMWLIDLDAAGSVSAERIDCPVPRPLARITGRLDDLLTDPRHELYEESWVEATLTDPARPREPMARLARRFPHLLSLVFAPERSETDAHASYAQRLRGRTDQQVAEDFVAHVRPGRGADHAERAVLGDVFDAVRVATDQEEAGEAARTEGKDTVGAGRTKVPGMRAPGTRPGADDQQEAVR
ncbi:exonuclease SbcCD subunit D [Streptomyces sp. HSW2009]|uniref:exonuclease SbcCD subunit D n=1 Tax=Streptomyces sp. HSW2009 TaxID=3142890 RepID=UPI0032F0043D